MKNASFTLEVVDIILPLLNLTEIAKLSAASKTLGSSVCDVLANSRPLELLVQGLEQTYSHIKGLLDGRSPLHRLWAVVGFLLDSRKIQCGPNIAATPGLTENLRQWFTVPCVPYTMACPFVEFGGLRMSYQQLLALARSRTLGVEVWVLVQKKLRMQSDIPDAVVNICCTILDQKIVLDPVEDPAEAVNTLQVAFNCEESAAADSAIQLIPQLDQKAVYLDLLLTAIERKHKEPVQCLLRQPLLQQLNVKQILRVLRKTVCVATSGRTQPWAYPTLDTAVVRELDQLPAAYKLTASDVVQVIHTALNRGAEQVAVYMCRIMRAVKHISVADLAKLLQLAAAGTYPAATHQLSQLPAAKDVSSAVVTDLLTAACNASMTADAHSATPYRFSQQQADKNDVIRTLCEFKAVAHITEKQLLQLAKAAIASGNCAFDVLYRTLQPMYEMFSESTAQSSSLLQELIDFQQQCNKQDTVTLVHLFQLPAAKGIPGLVISAYIRTAVLQRSSSMVQSLCESPAKEMLEAFDVALLLKDAIVKSDNDSIMLAALCGLPAASSVSASAVTELFKLVIERRKSNCVQLLCYMGAASLRRLEAGEVVQLESLARQHGMPYAERTIRHLRK